jgi:hypothetical protein
MERSNWPDLGQLPVVSHASYFIGLDKKTTKHNSGVFARASNMHRFILSLINA